VNKRKCVDEAYLYLWTTLLTRRRILESADNLR